MQTSLLFRKIFFFLFLLLILKNESVWGAASGLVPLESRTYSELTVLESFGLIKTVNHASRPYSRREVARQISEASKNFNAKKFEGSFAAAGEIEEAFTFLLSQYQMDVDEYEGRDEKQIDFKPLSSADAELSYLRAEPRLFRNIDTGLGFIDAVTQPLNQFRGGRDHVYGFQTSIESRHEIDVTKYLSFSVTPRFELELPTRNNEDVEVDPILQEGYGVLQVGNYRLLAGRAPIVIGEGEFGGYLLSNNARPLDHVQFSSDSPFRLPWIFDVIGDLEFQAFAADLGPESFFPHTYFAGYVLSFSHVKNWEWGIANMVQFGGEGAPSVNTSDIVQQFIGFAGTSGSKSNRILGTFHRVRIPGLRNSSLYGEWFFDDKNVSNLDETFRDYSSYLFGVEVPRLNDAGTLSGRVEFKYTGPIMYRHGLFASGYTLNQDIIGDPLGPDGTGVYAHVNYEINDQYNVGARLAYETSDSNQYFNTEENTVIANNNPREDRYRILLNGNYRVRPSWTLCSTFGYEYVTGWNYSFSDTTNNFLVRFGVNFTPNL